METTGETYIVLRWNPPRKYDSVKRLVQTLIKTKFTIDPVVEGPPPTVAASAAQVAASAAQPARPTSQRLPGGFLALKFHNHFNSSDAAIDKPSTAGLSIFFDRFISQGTFGQVFVAEYKGEKAVAKVFGSVKAFKELRCMKRQRRATTEERWEAARCEVAASAAFPPNKNI